MRLRNKKTGEIVDLIGSDRSGGFISIVIDFHDGNPKGYDYVSLAELNEEWEDVKEPLIKNEKIRKAVRAWAKAMCLDAVDYKEGEYGTVFCSDDNIDDYEYRIEFDQYLDLKDGCDSIADLCGEEE